MTERRKLLSLIFIAFLVLVLPIALLLSRQRQELRKKATGGGYSQGNLRVISQTVTVGSTIDVFVDATESESYGYIEGKLDYDTESFEPVGHWTAINPAHVFLAEGDESGEKFIFGANSSSNPNLLKGPMIMLTLLAREVTPSTNIRLLPIDSKYLLRGIKLDGSPSIFGSGTSGIDVVIADAATSTPTPTPTATARATTTPTATPRPTLSPDEAVLYPSASQNTANTFTYSLEMSFGQLPSRASVRIYYNGSQVVYAHDLTNGNGAFSTVTEEENNCSGSNCWIDIEGTNRKSTVVAGGRFAFVRIPFTFASTSVSSANITIGTETFVVKEPSGNFVLSYVPGASITYYRSAATASPTPTAVATVPPGGATPTPTAVPGAPVNSLSVTGPATLVGGKYQVTVHMNFNPVPRLNIGGELAGYTIKMLGSPYSTAPDSAMFRPEITDCSPFANPLPGDLRCSSSDTPAQDEIYIFESATPGSTKYIWAIFHNDAAHSAGAYWHNTDSSWSQPVSFGPIYFTPGDTNGNGCVGNRDEGYVYGHYQTSTECTPDASRRLPAPGPATNGDFNNDGCVDHMDVAVISENWRISCSE